MNRIPIRLRLALAFAFVMALVLAATGIFLYERQSSDLDEQIEREITARLAGVQAIIVDDGDDLGDPVHDPLERVDDEGFVQVLRQDGSIADATSDSLLDEPLLSPAEIKSIVSGKTQAIDRQVAAVDDDLRITADFARDDGERYTTIVAASLAQRDETLASLSRLLLVGGPIALILATLLAYAIVGAALRPVESMRAQAERISGARSGKRLPVPQARDEISSLGNTLNDMLGRIERSFERERAFVSDASHELRTPLSILKAELDLALARGRSPAELLAALESASEETNRLVKLADDLLVLARADEGRLPIAPETIDSSALLNRLAERFSARAGESDRTISVRDASGTFSADPARIEQALSNLIENALRYGDGEVLLAAKTVNGQVELHVRDSGPGLEPAVANHAFDRFARADGAEARAGAGLGLAIVDAIAQAHGGSAGVRNRLSGGADAYVALPHRS